MMVEALKSAFLHIVFICEQMQLLAKTKYHVYYVKQSNDSHDVAFSHMCKQNTAWVNILNI